MSSFLCVVRRVESKPPQRDDQLCPTLVAPVPRPSWIPDLIPPQSDGVLHSALDGPSAASRRAQQEKSTRRRLGRDPKIPERTAPIARKFGLISVLLLQIRMCCSGWNALLPVFKMSLVFQEWYEERHREPRLTLRPPSLAAPYVPVQSWHHQPEKLIFESCAYEANVRSPRSPSFW